MFRITLGDRDAKDNPPEGRYKVLLFLSFFPTFLLTLLDYIPPFGLSPRHTRAIKTRLPRVLLFFSPSTRSRLIGRPMHVARTRTRYASKAIYRIRGKASERRDSLRASEIGEARSINNRHVNRISQQLSASERDRLYLYALPASHDAVSLFRGASPTPSRVRTRVREDTHEIWRILVLSGPEETCMRSRPLVYRIF